VLKLLVEMIEPYRGRVYDPCCPGLKVGLLLANLHLSISDSRSERLRDHKRWHYGVLPARNANFASVQ
jgi:hypothetical protein